MASHGSLVFLYRQKSQIQARRPCGAQRQPPHCANLEAQLKEHQQRQLLRVLWDEDQQHWITKGYVIVKPGRAGGQCRAADRLLGASTRRIRTIHRLGTRAPSRHAWTELNNTGMVEIYNHQYLWDNRQEQRIYGAFVDIWDREDLWVTIDRANLNPPKKLRAIPNGFIHWDVDTTLDPPPIGVQGVLSLEKQDDAIGGFQCVPELFENFKELGEDPAGRPRPDEPGHDRPEDRQHRDGPGRPPDLQQPTRPWRPAQPLRDRVRMAQYIAMHPADGTNERRREELRLWRELDHPAAGRATRANGKSTTPRPPTSRPRGKARNHALGVMRPGAISEKNVKRLSVRSCVRFKPKHAPSSASVHRAGR